MLFLEELTSNLMKKLHICMRFIFKVFGLKFPLKKIFKIISFIQFAFVLIELLKDGMPFGSGIDVEKTNHVNMYYFGSVVCACTFSRYILITDPYCNCK